MNGIERRLARLERAGTGTRRNHNYVVRLPAEAMGDREAVRAAIEEHRQRTGYAGAVAVMPNRVTVDEWIALYGRSG